MYKTVLKIDGMMCSMCEAHINDALRKDFKVRKVLSSHSKGETVIISDEELDKNKLAETVRATGYELKEITGEPYEKKGITIFRKRS